MQPRKTRTETKQPISRSTRPPEPDAQRTPADPVSVLQRAQSAPGSLSAAELLELQPLIGNRQTGHLLTRGAEANAKTVANRTGLPDALKAGLEQLSGLDLSGVRVHYNSARPARLNAFAYTRGQHIEMGPGQERHLPHEGWHVVQQMQGRVRPTVQARGVTINDDEALEREADVMAARALHMGRPVGGRPAAGPYGSAKCAEPVIQGAFQKASMEENIFVEEGTGKRYVIVAFFDSTYVAVRDEANPSGQDVYLTWNAESGTWDVTEEGPDLNDPSVELEAEEEEILFNLGLRIPAQRGERTGPSLATSLTAQVSLVPIATGVAQVTEDRRDVIYTIDQIWVEALRLGNADRPETRYGNRQERHTVAWTLLRAAQAAQSNRPLTDVVGHYVRAMRELASEEQSENCGLLIRSVLVVADDLQKARLPIDVWQRQVSQMAVAYLQAYQQAGSATFQQGKPSGRNEAGHMATLRAAEEALMESPGNVDENAVVSAAVGLLDVGFYAALGPQGYVGAVVHWLDSLRLAFPTLMGAHEAAIRDRVYQRPVTQGVRERLNLQEPEATIGDLVKVLWQQHGPADAPAASQSLAQGGSSGMMLPIPAELESDFVANVSLIPAGRGEETTVVTQVSGQQAVDVQQLAYTAGEAVVVSVRVSDKDRPKTQYRTQMSHTVAWTLIRAELASFAGGPAEALLAALAERFTRIVGDLDTPEAVQLAQHSLAHALYFLGQRLPIHRWQAVVSDLVRGYVILYQRSRSATYVDLTTHGRALGHGEGAHMARLARNERAIINTGTLADDPAVVIQAATALFDGQINRTLSAEGLVAALLHWHEAISRVFPNVMAQIGADLEQHLATISIPESARATYKVSNLRDLVAALKPTIEAQGAATGGIVHR